ncbi:MAG: hypothetical protein C4K49_10240, partial [Candidatus Thorarchaeota archaeon]
PVRVGIAWQDSAMMQVGKSGITDGIVGETKRLLKKHRYMKVRLLHSSVGEEDSKRGVFEMLCERTGARLVGIRGNTAVIFKPRSKAKSKSD